MVFSVLKPLHGEIALLPLVLPENGRGGLTIVTLRAAAVGTLQ